MSGLTRALGEWDEKTPPKRGRLIPEDTVIRSGLTTQPSDSARGMSCGEIVIVVERDIVRDSKFAIACWALPLKERPQIFVEQNPRFIATTGAMFYLKSTPRDSASHGAFHLFEGEWSSTSKTMMGITHLSPRYDFREQLKSCCAVTFTTLAVTKVRRDRA